MSDGTYNRPSRLFEPRGQDERQDARSDARPEPRQDQRGWDFRGPDSRSSDSHGLDAGERRNAASDPLLELARLIGQSDPFAPPRGRAGDVPRGAPEQPERPPQDRAPFIRPRESAPAQDSSVQDRGFPGPALQDLHDRLEPDFRRSDPRPAPPPRFPLPPIQPDPAGAPHYAPDTAVFARLSTRDEHSVAPELAPADSCDDHYADPQAAQYQAPQYQAAQYGAEQQHVAQHDAANGQQNEYAGEYAGEYAEGGEYEQEGEYEFAEPDEGQGDTFPGKRRNTAKIAILVLGLAVFGSAAAFGYRTVFKGGPSGPTPIIRADTSPTKVMPVGVDANMKPISERVGDGSGERVVRRDEDPVDLSRASSGAGGVIGGGGYQGTTGFPLSSAAAPSSSGPASPSEPRKVKTVTIRADQGTPQGSPAAAAPPSNRQRQAAVAPPAAASGGAPMAITPDAPAARAPAPAAPRTSDGGASSGGGGGYVVQLSAQKSEAEAQASFRSMQAKYSQLSGRQPMIRKKDTDKGVFYAALIGPFGAKDEAEQLCQSLKSVGGTCFVYRN
jgi:hypothetical protein